MQKPSAIAEWCRTFDCYLDGKLAVICGWENQFATIATLDGTQAIEFSWAAVSRIMGHGVVQRDGSVLCRRQFLS